MAGKGVQGHATIYFIPVFGNGGLVGSLVQPGI
jgi:hypothetical protein